MIINLIKTLWAKWKQFAHILGRIQTTILLSVIYFLIIPCFSFLRLKDPLCKRLGKSSYWQTFKTRSLTIDDFRRMF